MLFYFRILKTIFCFLNKTNFDHEIDYLPLKKRLWKESNDF